MPSSTIALRAKPDYITNLEFTFSQTPEDILIPRQFRIHALLLFTFLLLIFIPIINKTPDAEQAEKATASVMRFFAQIDAREYERSWQDAAEVLKKKVSQKDWVEELARVSDLLGPQVERSQTEISRSLGGEDDPEGEYIVQVFESKFKRVEAVTETVSLRLEEDANWRVAGYHTQVRKN